MLAAHIEAFLSGDAYAVVGASEDRSKYGNKVLRCYLQNGRTVYPVNPSAATIEGVACHPDLRRLPGPVHGVSVITPPNVTEVVVEHLPASGAAWVWMQPGAESDSAIARAEALGIRVIAGGPCLLVALGFRESG
jgi:predicted CoA-binding protein